MPLRQTQWYVDELTLSSTGPPPPPAPAPAAAAAAAAEAGASQHQSTVHRGKQRLLFSVA